MKHSKSRFVKTSIKRVPKESGLSIEEIVRQAIATNSPIEGKAPMIYTPAAEGVNAAYNIRTDKQNLALQANDKYQGSEAMKGFMSATEYDENGFDGKGNQRPVEPKEQKTTTETTQQNG